MSSSKRCILFRRFGQIPRLSFSHRSGRAIRCYLFRQAYAAPKKKDIRCYPFCSWRDCQLITLQKRKQQSDHHTNSRENIHTAEMFSSGASGFSHYKFGNINKKLFRTILIPGVLGAIIGALLLSYLGEKYAGIIKPILAVYTFILGIRILLNAFKKNKIRQKTKRVGWLAGAGGFLDSFGGGGWGPLVTSTLISKGKTPRYVIGTVSLTEFFVTFASALTFFSVIGISHWQLIAGLILGGVLAAPIAARLAGKLPLKAMFIGVGAIVIIWSLNVLLKTMHLI